jgi:hypothetical protein
VEITFATRTISTIAELIGQVVNLSHHLILTTTLHTTGAMVPQTGVHAHLLTLTPAAKIALPSLITTQVKYSGMSLKISVGCGSSEIVFTTSI